MKKTSNPDASIYSAEYVTLKKLIAEAQERVHKVESALYKEFHKSLPTYVLPCDADLNWWGSFSSVVTINHDGTLRAGSTSVPRVLSGRDSKQHKAGSKFKVVTSWKTGKKTKGTHYILTSIGGKYPRVTHFYG